MNIAIISCVKTKRLGKMKAKDLYNSTLFKFSYKYVLNHYDKIYILSTLYGVLEPDDQIEYYEMTLNEMNAKQKKAWAYKTALQLKSKIQPEDKLYYYCGVNYRKNLIEILPNEYEIPLKGLSFGQQLQWYKQRIQ